MSGRRILTGALVLLTIALIAVGFLYTMRGSAIGFALHAGAVIAAIAAWICLGMPVKRSDINLHA